MTKNTLKKLGPRTWCTKKPFGYRVAHQNSLTSCPGQVSLTPCPVLDSFIKMF